MIMHSYRHELQDEPGYSFSVKRRFNRGLAGKCAIVDFGLNGQLARYRTGVAAKAICVDDFSPVPSRNALHAVDLPFPSGILLMGTPINSNFRDEVLGVARAATGMYALVHEDCEHDTTTQFARKTDL